MDVPIQCNSKPRRQTLMLVLTEYCNLQCIYCYEHKQDRGVLPLEIAQKAITEAFQNPDYDELEIDFFGGEPFVAFKRITEICDWTWSRAWPKPYIFFATTNGTLVHGKIRDWLKVHKDGFVAGLSLDGTPEMHNMNRSHSYADIDVDFFKEQWPDQRLKMTVSRQTLPTMAEGIIYLHRMGFHLTANPAEGVSWSPEDYTVYERELKKLADFYIDTPNVEPINMLDMKLDVLMRAEDPFKIKAKNYCGAGRAMMAIDLSGKRYPCQTFMPMSGAKGSVEEMMEALLDPQKNKNDPKCRDCPLLVICPTCYGLNYARTGDPFTRGKDYCVFQKLRAKAVAYMWAGMLTHGDRDYVYLGTRDSRDITAIIKAVEFVSEHIHI